MKRLVRFLLAAAVLFGAVLLAGYLMLRNPRPDSQPGPRADALAKTLVGFSSADGWARTAVVSWKVQDRREHLWDRRRGFVRVRWDEHEVLLRTADVTGVAYRAGAQVDETEAKALLQTAWEFWINDAFWLNPFASMFDAGVTRELVRPPGGGEGLVVRYASGGATPGDSYQWFIDSEGQPTHWRMWVSRPKVPGLEVSWEQWKTLSTGARLATRHQVGPITFELRDVQAAERLEALTPKDPFLPLVGANGSAASRPASAPATGTSTRPASAPATGTSTDS